MGSISIFTFENFEFPDSPEHAGHARVSHSVITSESVLFAHHAGASNDTKAVQDNTYPFQRLPPPSLLLSRPVIEIRSLGWQNTKDIHSINDDREQEAPSTLEVFVGSMHSTE